MIGNLNRTIYGASYLAETIQQDVKQKQQQVVIKVSDKLFANKGIVKPQVGEKHETPRHVPENIHREKALLKFLSTIEDQRKQYIAKIIQVVEDERYEYCVMENGGKDLNTIITEDNAKIDKQSGGDDMAHYGLKESIVRVWFRQLVQVIQCLHQHHIAHMDISTENLCVNLSTGHVQLIDFGVAIMHPSSPHLLHLKQYPQQIRLVPELSSSLTQFFCEPIFKIEQIPGKVPSMATELVHFRTFNAYSADAYSLGVLLFQALCGRPAYIAPVATDVWHSAIFQGEWLHPAVRSQPTAHRVFGHLSADALDLIDRLIIHASKRLSVNEILLHPFLQVDEKTMIADQQDVQDFIKQLTPTIRQQHHHHSNLVQV